MAKIYVIGTSNSIIGMKGYIAALGNEHDIVNRSCGRSPLLFHMAHILQNRAAIEECDILIIDHYGNDANFYGGISSFQYDERLEDLYFLLSTLNVHIINILFPRQKTKHKDIKAKVISKSRKYGISYIDLDEASISKKHYIDNFHINRAASYIFGMHLSRFVSGIPHAIPNGGHLHEFPARLVLARDLFAPEAIKTFSNRISNIEFSSLCRDAHVHAKDSEKLISIGYFREFGLPEKQGFKIGGISRAVVSSDYGLFYEFFDGKVFGGFKVSSLVGDMETVPVLAGRGYESGKFAPSALVSMMIHDGEVNAEGVPANRAELKFPMNSISSCIDDITSLTDFRGDRLSPKSVDAIRDCALSYEKSNIKVASELMSLALSHRPGGPLIRKKANEYKIRAKEP